MSMRIRTIIIVFCLGALALAVPSQISFQGVLKDSSGSPITGSREITFTIFGSSTGPGHSWTETQTISIEAGLYNVQLGAVTPLSASDFDGFTKYLGISIGGTELLPRVMMVSVPYAYRADQATYADTAGSSGGFPNSVLLTPGTAQTTNAAGAIWIKSSASGVNADNMANVVSVESTGDHTYAAQFKNGGMVGRIAGRPNGNTSYYGALIQYGDAIAAVIGFRWLISNPYYLNCGGLFEVRGSETEYACGLSTQLDGGNSYGYAAKFTGGIGIVLPDSTGAISALVDSIDTGTLEGTVRYDGNTHDFFGWAGGGKGWVKLNN